MYFLPATAGTKAEIYITTQQSELRALSSEPYFIYRHNDKYGRHKSLGCPLTQEGRAARAAGRASFWRS